MAGALKRLGKGRDPWVRVPSRSRGSGRAERAKLSNVKSVLNCADSLSLETATTKVCHESNPKIANGTEVRQCVRGRRVTREQRNTPHKAEETWVSTDFRKAATYSGSTARYGRSIKYHNVKLLRDRFKDVLFISLIVAIHDMMTGF